jgi:UDP-N-acetylmuramoylalanine--D-glutamate ligase
MLDSFRSMRITVMGLGRFGGGAGVCRWLLQQNAHVHLTDCASAAALQDSLAEFSPAITSGRMSTTLGTHEPDDFTGCDLVVANPAVPTPWKNRFLLAAEDAGVPITTEIRLLIERLDRARVIGVTGTAGKSTTTAMIHHLLDRAGIQTHIGGNIGGSLLPVFESISHDDWIVLELSSAMLYWLGAGIGYEDAVGWSPHIAVLTNIQPNHLDWHESFEHYQQSKHNIFRFQDAPDHAVREADEQDLPALNLSVPGPHNQRNAHMAIRAVQHVIDISIPEASHLLHDFTGLPHRLQLVLEHDGMRYYNDSKSTTPEATLLAIKAMDEPARTHLIAGGYDKKIDLQGISDASAHLAGMYTIGSTGRVLHQAAPHDAPAFVCGDLESAVQCAIDRMKPGDALLLSPGCASWDQFTNYEQRGEAFINAVHRHLNLRWDTATVAPDPSVP